MSSHDEIVQPLAADPVTFIPPGVNTYVSLRPFGGGVPTEEYPAVGAGQGPAVSPFVLKRRIGYGGQGEVWEAWQTSLNREVAVKVHRGGNTRGFLGEAFLTGELDHPNIVPVLDLGTVNTGDWPQGALAMAMKRVRGSRWDDLIQRDRPADGSLPHHYLARHLGVLMGVCHAVAYAHSRGVVHLDLKPSQVIVGDFGEIYLMDWGLAARLKPGADGTVRQVAEIDEPTGTPGYMAPEQAHGDGESIGVATDVYLLGALAFHILAGLPPHPCSTLGEGLMAARRNALLPLPPSAPMPLRQIVERALAFSPSGRQGSAEEFRAEIEDFLGATSQQREAEALLAGVREGLENAAALDYAALAELERNATRARGLCPSLPGTALLRDAIVERHAKLAIERGDLDLATILVGGIEDGALRAPLEQRTRTALGERGRRDRQRVLARGVALVALALLATVLGLSSQLLFSSFREADSERRSAEGALARARRELYRASVQAALGHAEHHRYADGRHALKEAPEELRGWEWGLLANMSEPERLLFAPRDERYDALALNDAGTSLAAIRHSDGALRVFDARSAKLLEEVAGPPGDRWRVLAAARGAGFVAATERGVVQHVGTTGDVAPVALEGAVTLLAPGPATAVALEDGRLILLPPGGGIQSILEPVSKMVVTAAAWSADGEWLAVGTKDGWIAAYHRPSGKWTKGDERHTRPVSEIAWNPARPEFVTIACWWQGDQPFEDRRLLLWNAGNKTAREIEKSEFLAFTALCFTSDGSRLLASLSSTNLKRYDTATWQTDAGVWEQAGTISRVLRTPDDQRIVTIARDRVSVRDNIGLTLVRDFEPDPVRVSGLAVSNSLIYAAGERGGLAGWGVENGEHTDHQNTFPDRVLSVDAAASAPFLLAGHMSGTIEVFDTRHRPPVPVAHLWHEGPLVQARLSSDGTRAASINGQGLLRMQNVWDPERPEKVGINVQGEPVALAMAPNGSTVAYSTIQGALALVERDGLQRSLPPCAAGEHWTALEFSGDGQRLFAGRSGGTIDVFDLATASAVGRIEGHTRAVNRLLARGGRLMSASEDETARLWDSVTGAPEGAFQGSHAGGVVSAVLTHDGSRVITACRDWNVRVFERDTEAELLVMQRHQFGIVDMALDSDGLTLHTIGREGHLRRWYARRWDGRQSSGRE